MKFHAEIPPTPYKVTKPVMGIPIAKTPPVTFPNRTPPHPHIFLCYSRRIPVTLTVHMIQLTPTAEHPLPFDLSDEQPKTHADSIAIAANTADLIDQLGGSIDYSEEDEEKARALIKGEAKGATPKTVSSAGVAKKAAHILKSYDYQAIADAIQARNFITNKLIELADCGDPRFELKALELLGKHSDIGIFTERSEITVHHTTSTALENSIKDRIKRLLNTTVTDITPIDDLDAQLGLTTYPEEQDVDPENPDGDLYEGDMNE